MNEYHFKMTPSVFELSKAFCPIRDWALRSPDSAAIHFYNKTALTTGAISYQALDAKINALVQFLRDNHYCQTGDWVLLRANLSLDFILTFWALMRLGMRVVLTGEDYSVDWIEHIEESIMPSLALFEDKSHVFRALPQEGIHWQLKAEEGRYPIESLGAQIGILTSGSTGFPKLVLHDYTQYFISASVIANFAGLSDQTNWLLSLSLFHAGGLSVIFRCFYAGASCSIMLPRLELMDKKLFRMLPITHVSLVNAQLIHWYQRYPREYMPVRFAYLGGGVIDSALTKTIFDPMTQVIVGYAMSETASTIAARTLPSNVWTPAFQIFPHCALKLDSTGEICVKSDSLCLGYYQEGHLVSIKQEDDWFHTGDLGQFVQKDDQSYLEVIGRKDNRFISGGENIYPEEIEKELMNCDEILFARVLGLDVSDRFGKRPVAFIFSPLTLDEEIIRTKLLQHLPKFKIPIYFIRLSEDNFFRRMKLTASDLIKCYEEYLSN